MTRTDVDVMIDWAADEGWNPGLRDGDPFYATDPGGFFLGEIDDQPVACISVVRYGESFGFLGFYIVHPEFRGRGFGMQIWQAGMRHLANRNVGLDGVVAQQDNYRRSGFVYAYGNQRYEGVGASGGAEDVVPLSEVPFDDIAAYDAGCFGLERKRFLEAWLNQYRGYAVIEDGALRGFGVIRPCRIGHKVGPLFCDNPAVADRIFRALIATVPGEAVFLDIPLPNAEAGALTKRYDMAPVFETARMYTQGDPGVPLQRVFGVTTFELG